MSDLPFPGKAEAQFEGMSFARDRMSITVTGRTYPHRDRLVVAGFSWFPSRKEWIGNIAAVVSLDMPGTDRLIQALGIETAVRAKC